MFTFITSGDQSEIIFGQIMIGLFFPFVVLGISTLFAFLLAEAYKWVTDSTKTIPNPAIVLFARFTKYNKVSAYGNFENKEGNLKGFSDMVFSFLVFFTVLYYGVVFYNLGIILAIIFAIMYTLRITIRVKTALSNHIEDKKAHK